MTPATTTEASRRFEKIIELLNELIWKSEDPPLIDSNKIHGAKLDLIQKKWGSSGEMITEGIKLILAIDIIVAFPVCFPLSPTVYPHN